MMMRTRMRMRRCLFISCKSHGMYEHVGMVEIQTICDISLRTIVKRRRNTIFELVFIKAFGGIFAKLFMSTIMALVSVRKLQLNFWGA